MFIIVRKKKLVQCMLAISLGLVAIGMGRESQVFLGTPAQTVSAADNGGDCYLAIVIDDFGYCGEGTEDMLALPVPLTAAVMPFSDCSEHDAKLAEQYGKETIIHMPMESLTGKRSWVGDKGVFRDLTDEEIHKRVEEAHQIVPNAIGLNNHMGSAIMEDKRCLSAVMDIVSEKGFLFLDSMTTPNSVSEEVCSAKNVMLLKRNVFLDSTDDINVVKKQLRLAADTAKKQGSAIAIGHVGPEGGNITVQAIRELAPELEREGITFVSLSELAQRQQK